MQTESETTFGDVQHSSTTGNALIMDFNPKSRYYQAAQRHWNAIVRVDGEVVSAWHYVNVGSGFVVSLATNLKGERYLDHNTGQPGWKLWRGVVTVEQPPENA